MKDVIVFGTGRKTEKMLRYIMSSGYGIKFFVDNDSRKWGTVFEGKEVRSPLCILDERNDIPVLISTEKYRPQIEQQLRDLGEYYRRTCTGIVDFLYELERPKYLCQSNLINTSDRKNESISVLFDSQIFSAQRNGGISRYFIEVINYLVNKKEISVSFFQGINDSVFRDFVSSNDCEQYYSVQSAIADVQLNQAINSSLFRDFVKGNSYDIYHPTYYSEYGVNTYKKLVVTVHDMIHEIYNISPDESEKKRSIVNHADGIIAVSENTKEDLIRIFGIPETKIKVIYEGNSLNRVVTESPLQNGVYILYVGNRSGYKNAEMLMRAFSKSKCKTDYKLVFMGGGDLKASEMQLIDSLGISNQVIVHQGDDEVLANLYNYADFFVYPSKYEGFGIPILEAMHYGTPVITADSSSTKEIAGDAAMLFNPDEEDDLVDALNRMAQNKETRHMYSERGNEREKLFSWERCAEQIEVYYRELLCR